MSSATFGRNLPRVCGLATHMQAASYRGFRKSEDGTFFAYAGRSAGEPIRAAKACMGWGESAPMRANSAVADLGRPDSISLVCASGRA